MPKRITSDIDAIIGKKIRRYRMKRGITQPALAKRVGISFQQLQNYESNVNKISASMLFEFAQILQCKCTCDLLPNKGDRRVPPSHADRVIATRDGIRLVNAFAHIDGKDARSMVVELALSLAKVDGYVPAKKPHRRGGVVTIFR